MFNTNPNKYSNEQLIGRKFGKLIVLEQDKEKSKERRTAVFKCQCDCGNIYYAERPKLLKGITKHCNKCLDNKCAPGMKFGKLTIIGDNLEESKRLNCRMVNCKCDCGKELVIPRSDILNGTRKSCTECIDKNIKDLTGQKFGMLTVLKYDENLSKRSKKTFWICKCDCGKEISTTANNLTGGISTSCGCKRKMYAKSQIKDETGNVFGNVLVLGINNEESIKSGVTMFNCRCMKCGEEFITRGASLRSGLVTSCGKCSRVEDLTGQKFGRLTVLEFDHISDTKRTMWKCQCDCGNIVVVDAHGLKRGNTKSCGCLIRENLKSRAKYGAFHSELKSKYDMIMDRCYNPNNENYHNYGGRGIKVCDRWLGENGFDNFYFDMIDGFYPGLTVDRIDVNGNYSPENCRWLDRKGQNYNKRNNVYVDYYGKRICLSELAEKFAKSEGITGSTISHRIKYGFSIDEALSMPLYTNVNRSNYFKENNPIRKPFMFDYELNDLNLYAQDIIYEKPDPKKFLKNAPTAEDYWKKDDNEEEKK